jgi:sugar/nucleoside kinase (ribokinase family)
VSARALWRRLVRILPIIGRGWKQNNVDTSAIIEIPDDFTASFFVSTDGKQNQIAMFYTGAMAHAHKLIVQATRAR